MAWRIHKSLNRKMRIQRKISYAAILVGLAVVLSLFSIKITESFQLGVTEIPLMLSGFILGPLFGAIVGFVKDVFTMIKGGYPPSIFTLSPIILGLIPGLFLKIFGRERLYNSAVLIFTAVIIAGVLRTLNNTLALYVMFGTPWTVLKATLAVKLLIVLGESVIYVILFRLLLPRLKRVFDLTD